MLVIIILETGIVRSDSRPQIIMPILYSYRLFRAGVSITTPVSEF
jgi:hypothetical protein